MNFQENIQNVIYIDFDNEFYILIYVKVEHTVYACFVSNVFYYFQFQGLTSENDENSKFLGRFTYEDNGVSLQKYDAQVFSVD